MTKTFADEIQYETVDGGGDGIPTSFSLADVGTSDLTCEVCGTPLVYAGRGRKPRFCDEHKQKRTASTSRRGSADVNLACDSLRQAYDALVFPIAMVSPSAGRTWMDQIDALDARNRAFLATNKDLVRKINAAAEKGGTAAFTISHLVAVAPVVLVVLQERTAKREQRRAAQEAQQTPDGFAPMDPDAIFNRANGAG